MDKREAATDECSHRAPLFTFGVISDIQYADINDGSDYNKTRRRFYRNSLQLLRNAVRSWSSVRPGFILQLGDVIDGFNKRHGASKQALESVLTELSSGEAEVHHVWGNHEFYNFNRRELMRSELNSAPRGDGGLLAQDIYAYSFSPAPGFTFVVLDAYDVSVLGREESSKQHRTALDLIKCYNSNQDLNCPPTRLDHARYTMFNGGFSKTQLDWLDDLLSAADEKHERVTIVNHIPVHPKAADPICLAWNYDELLSVLRCHRSVVCFLAGHAHDGEYYWDKDTRVHHLTLDAVIETPPDSDAFGTVSVYEDRMVLQGTGRVCDQVFMFPTSDANQR